MLCFDFSDVNEQNVAAQFTKIVNETIEEFSEKYYQLGLLYDRVTIDPTDFRASFASLARNVRLKGEKLSVIVDEVDAFANRLLMQGALLENQNVTTYHEFVKSEGSLLRRFGRTLKKHSSTCIERSFYTGVMPVAWSDAFSSLNIVEDLTHTVAFNDTLGFKTTDVEELLSTLYPTMTPAMQAKHLEAIRNKCNGYRRSSAQTHGMYNPQGVWFCLKQLRDQGDLLTMRLDPNIVQPAKDEFAAFLVKHASGMQSLV